MIGSALLVAGSAPVALAEELSAAAGAEVFALAQDVCTRDAGALWARSLCGPMLLVDAGSRKVVANQKDGAGILKATPVPDVYEGALPADVVTGNTALEWSGARWTMLLWPVPDDEADRRQLLAHELWHRVQKDIGLPMAMPENGHLDEREPRYWLRLEWRALARALRAQGRSRRSALEDALAFRAARRAPSSPQGRQEVALERNEGLAQYTGVRLSGRRDLERYAAESLARAERDKSFVRTFAYASGPAYGLLLDANDPKWRRGLHPASDLGTLAAGAYGIPRAGATLDRAQRAAGRHDGRRVAREEDERARVRLARVKAFRQRYSSAGTLTLPLREMRLSFDPGAIEAFEGGMVYAKLRLSDLWGTLEAPVGGLVSTDFTRAVVPGPFRREGARLLGPDWTIDLRDGWEADDEAGHVRLRPTQATDAAR